MVLPSWENLVAIILLGMVLTSNTRFLIQSMQANNSARTYSTLVNEVQQRVDGLRSQGYNQLLTKFSSTYSTIDDGDTIVENATSLNSPTTFRITYTAIKTSNTATPEAVQVSINATQRRGGLGNATLDFETVIASLR